jgi:hypothetical protein
VPVGKFIFLNWTRIEGGGVQCYSINIRVRVRVGSLHDIRKWGGLTSAEFYILHNFIYFSHHNYPCKHDILYNIKYVSGPPQSVFVCSDFSGQGQGRGRT